MKHGDLSLAVGWLGLCILAGSWLVAGSLRAYATQQHPPSAARARQSPRLLTLPELAQYLGIPTRAARHLGPHKTGQNITSSSLPFVRIQGHVYYPLTGVNQWLATR
jgi:hypothetical protein